MLCDECGKNPASIKMVIVVAGERRELNLCPECAAKRRIPPKSIGMGQLLAAVATETLARTAGDDDGGNVGFFTDDPTPRGARDVGRR